VKLQWVELRQWGPLVGTPSTPENGCGQYSYGGLCCSYVEHKEGSHSMCVDVFNYTSSRYGQ
jgi:hypothetical protein